MSMEKGYPKKHRAGFNPELKALVDYFHQFESTQEFAYNQALIALDALEKSASTPQEIIEFMMEDIIFTALYTTIYEELFSALRSNQDVALPLIEKFSESSEERDSLINTHTQNHMNFIFRGGECNGCTSCEGHADLAPLLVHWHKKDMDYFIRLYLEVQSIHCMLERVLYEYLPMHPDFMKVVNPELINKYRLYIADYVQGRLSNS